MISYEVDGMSCNHCVGAITRAIQSTDAKAQVKVDLASKKVSVDGGAVTAQHIEAAISDAGYEIIKRIE